MRKEKHMKDLNDQIFYFTNKRDELVLRIEGIVNWYEAMETENMVLRSQKQELERRLKYAMTVCGWYGGDGVSMPLMGGVQEPWLRPWEQQYQSSNSICVMSSDGIFQF